MRLPSATGTLTTSHAHVAALIAIFKYSHQVLLVKHVRCMAVLYSDTRTHSASFLTNINQHIHFTVPV